MTNGFNYAIQLNVFGSPGLQSIIAMSEKFEKQLGSIDAKVGGVSKSLIDMGNKGSTVFSNLVGMAGRFIGVTALIGAGRGMFQFTADMEQTHMSFEVLLKDANKANELIGKLNKFADITPFDNKEVISAGKSLVALGFDAQSVIPKLTMLGDLASGMTIPLNELTSAYAKMRNKGKIQAEELNIFLDRGVNILPQLQRKFGDVWDAAEKGKITFADLDNALTQVSRNQFGGLMARQAETLGGQWSTLLGEVQQLTLQIGNELLPTAKALISEWLIPGAHWIRENGQSIVDFGIAIGSLAFVYQTWSFWQMLSNGFLFAKRALLLVNIGALTGYELVSLLASTATQGFTASLATLNATLWANPVGLFIGALVVLGGAFYYAWEKSETFRATMTGIGYVFKWVGGVLWDFGMLLYGVGETMVGVFTGNYDLIVKGGLDTAKALESLSDDFFKAGQTVGDAYNKGWNSVPNESIVGSSDLDKYYAGKEGDALSKAGFKGSSASPDDKTKKGIEAINGGGSHARNVTISINTVKVADQVTVQNDATHNAPIQLTDEIMKRLIQIINSGNSVQLN